MKWIFVLTALIICFQSYDVFAKNCEDCPANNPCVITTPKGDKCNTCEIKVHCSDSYWFQGDKKCTFLDCTVLTPIENPFEIEGEETI
ncbi:MAG: hypothetical protein ACR2NC_00620 [Thermodesulfobacteriota bacterium]